MAADGPAIARRFYETAAAHATCGESLFLDVPQSNPDTKALLAALGLTQVFETALMYTGPDSASELPKLFGVTTFELG
jgi:Acetyltransferase (GNAT) domain